jgi:hypothetical protein
MFGKYSLSMTVLVFANEHLPRLASLGLVAMVGCAPPATQPTRIETQSNNRFTFTAIPPVVVELPAFFREDTTALEHTFEVINPTEEKVAFMSIRQSCACSEAYLAHREVPPAGRTQLKMAIHTIASSGTQRYRCELTDQYGRVWTYIVKTEVLSRVKVTPSFVSFGSIDPDKEASATINIILSSPSEQAAARILSVTCTSDIVHLSLQQPAATVTESGLTLQTSQLVSRLVASSQSGSHNAMITFAYEWKGAVHELKIPVMWNIRSLFAASPARLFFGAVEQGSNPLQRAVNISRTDGASFQITRIESNNPAITVAQAVTLSSPSHQLVVTLNPVRAGRVCVGDIVVETDCVQQPRFCIPFAAMHRDREAEPPNKLND